MSGTGIEQMELITSYDVAPGEARGHVPTRLARAVVHWQPRCPLCAIAHGELRASDALGARALSPARRAGRVQACLRSRAGGGAAGVARCATEHAATPEETRAQAALFAPPGRGAERRKELAQAHGNEAALTRPLPLARAPSASPALASAPHTIPHQSGASFRHVPSGIEADRLMLANAKALDTRLAPTSRRHGGRP